MTEAPGDLPSMQRVSQAQGTGSDGTPATSYLSDPVHTIPIFHGTADALQWWAVRLRAEGFYVSIDGLTSESGAAFMLGRRPRTLANWRSAGIGPAWRRRGQVVYPIFDLIEWDNDSGSQRF